jgi:hypothetical protein
MHLKVLCLATSRIANTDGQLRVSTSGLRGFAKAMRSWLIRPFWL